MIHLQVLQVKEGKQNVDPLERNRNRDKIKLDCIISCIYIFKVWEFVARKYGGLLGCQFSLVGY